MAFSHKQQKALSIIPHFTGFFSFCGSSWIIYEVVKDRKKWGRTYHRLMLAISIFDLFQSVANGLSTIPIPRGTKGVYDPMGTTATCTAQGLFVQMGLTSSCYNGMLAIYYVLLIRYGMPERKIKRSIEPLMHATTLLINFGFTFSALGLDLYNNASLWCWIGTYPGNCQGSSGEPGPVPCERGYNAWIYRWAFFFAPLWFVMLLTSVLMFLLYRHVRTQERKMLRYEHTVSRRCSAEERRKEIRKEKSRRRLTRTKKVASQAVFYVGAFYLTWIFGTINRLQQLVSPTPVFGLMLMHSIFVPMQGAFNFMVYMRPRFIRFRKKRRNERIRRSQRQSHGNLEVHDGTDQVENASNNNAGETGEKDSPHGGSNGEASDKKGARDSSTSHSSQTKRSGSVMQKVSLVWKPTLSDNLSRLRMSTVLDISVYNREFEEIQESDDDSSVDSGVQIRPNNSLSASLQVSNNSATRRRVTIAALSTSI